MKQLIVYLTASALIIFSAQLSNADLFNRGNGLVYDDDLDITWLQDADFTGSTMTWQEASDWAASLVFQGYDDWRLPVSDVSCSGYNCNASEMGHLFYVEEVTSESPGLFSGVNPYMYWSGTSYNENKAWRFNFQSGYQGASSMTYSRYAWAVRDGDSLSLPVAPEPVGSLLFITGSVTLLACRRMGRTKT